MRMLGLPAMHGEAPALGGFDQPGASSLFEAVSGRSHKETCAGCIVSLTTVTSSAFSASRSVYLSSHSPRNGMKKPLLGHPKLHSTTR